MKILVCGDRNWKNADVIRRVLHTIQHDVTLLVHGAARGADSLAAQEAENLHIPTKSFPADWNTHGKSAGIIRNITMFKETNPDLVIAFHDDLTSSKGTKHMAQYAHSHNVRVLVINSRLDVYSYPHTIIPSESTS